MKGHMKHEDIVRPVADGVVFIPGKRLGVVCDNMNIGWCRLIMRQRKLKNGNVKTKYAKGVVVSQEDAPKVKLAKAYRVRKNNPIPDEFVFIPFKHRHLAERCERMHIFFYRGDGGIYIYKKDQRKALRR
jgi:hypothetical protein